MAAEIQTTMYDTCKTCHRRHKKPVRYNIECKICKKLRREGKNLAVDEDEVNFGRDIQWAYKNMGNEEEFIKKEAPSDAARALLEFASTHRKEFVARFMAWNQKREEQRGVTIEEMKEDEKKTLRSLDKLMMDINPDIGSLLLEANNMFPIQFKVTMHHLGWVYRPRHARPDMARNKAQIGPIDDDEDDDDSNQETPAIQEPVNGIQG